MVRSVLARLGHLVLVLWLVTLATFLMLELVPGDPATAALGTSGTPEQYARVHTELGLDEPLPQRYVDWLGGALTGDLGVSLTPPVQDVSDMIRSRLPVTTEIAVLGMVMALAAAVPLGLWSAHRAGTRVDRATSGIMFAILSVPSFLAGLLLIRLFVFEPGTTRIVAAVVGALGAAGLAARAVRLHADDDTPGARVAAGSAVLTAVAVAALVVRWPDLPRQEFVRLTAEEGLGENLRHAFLPALTVAVGELAVFTRLLRADLVETLQRDFILAARAKGLSDRRVLWRHALRPSSFSLMTVAGISLGRLLGGTMIVEVLFGLPGMGRLLVDSIAANDYTVVQGAVLVLATAYVLVNAAVDVLYVVLDPRLRHAA
jgi:peptide/nickel transport system permease protein